MIEQRIHFRFLIFSLMIACFVFFIIPLFEAVMKKKPVKLKKTVQLLSIKQVLPSMETEKEVSPFPPKVMKLGKASFHSAKSKNIKIPLFPSFALDVNPFSGDFSIDFDLVAGHFDGNHVFELSEVDTPPEPIFQIAPHYPTQAKSRGIEGEVELAFIVDDLGQVGEIRIQKSYPKRIFDSAAINAVKNWKFKPATKNGANVSSWAILPIQFQLENKK